MADQNLMGSWYIQQLEAGSVSFSSGTLTNAAIAATAAIAASKLVNRVLARYQLADGADIAATGGDGFVIYTNNCAGAATLKSVTVVCPDAPSGGDKAFTVDVKKAANGTAATTVLSSPVAYSATQADYEQEAGALSVTSIPAGHTLLAVVAVSGSTGNQGQGLLVQCEIEEPGT